MVKNPKAILHQCGFTLVEMAVVLVIVGLLLGGLLVPLSVQRDLKDYGNTKLSLDQAKEALYGYALSHSAVDGKPYLPCPDTDQDGYENRAGADCDEDIGDLPTGDLGLQRTDAWDNRFRYRVSPDFASSATGFILSHSGNITVLDNAGDTVVSGIPALILSSGKNGAGAPASPGEAENADTDATFVSHEHTDTFDDLVVWLSTSVLMNRMVTAGQLP